MAKIIVYLGEQERNALHQRAQREMRAPSAQAALIIRKELARLGMPFIPAESPNVELSEPKVLENQA